MCLMDAHDCDWGQLFISEGLKRKHSLRESSLQWWLRTASSLEADTGRQGMDDAGAPSGNFMEVSSAVGLEG